MLEVYKIIIKIFPKFSKAEYFNEEPVFVEFASKITGNIKNKEYVPLTAKLYNDSHFMWYGKITEKNAFIKELEKRYIEQDFHVANLYGEFEQCRRNRDSNCEDCSYYKSAAGCQQNNVRCEAEKNFKQLVNETKGYLKLLYDEVHKRNNMLDADGQDM